MQRDIDTPRAGRSRSPHTTSCACACLLTLVWAANASAQISGWRGDGSGRWPQADPPMAWDSSTGKNILWQAKVGKGQSTPTVVRDRALVTAEPDKLLCVDCRDGKVLWQCQNNSAALGLEIRPAEEPLEPAPGCGFSAATPVTDGKLVYVCYGSGVIACYDLDGHRQWARYIDLPQTTQYGRSASPLLAGGKLLITLSTLLALDPLTGATCWQAEKASAEYGTPAIARIDDVDVALTPAGVCLRISDGTILARKLGELQYGSPIVHDGVAYFVGPITTAVKLPDKVVDSFQPALLWKSEEVEGETFASPLWHDGYLYCANNEGTLYVLNAATGALVYRKELPIRPALGNGEPANIYPSITLAGPAILCSNDVGETVVLAAGSEYKELAVNRLSKGSGACPLPHERTLLLRGGSTFYCIQATEPR